MIQARVIPCLTLEGTGLVKTVQFKDPKYLGDPRNAVRIFNDKEVDELVLLDIRATAEGTPIQYDLIQEIVSEAFMPVAYGGGIQTVDQAKRIVHSGVEKAILSTAAFQSPDLIRACSDQIGASSTVVCLDVKRSILGKYEVYTRSGKHGTKMSPVQAAEYAQKHGAGELVIHSIDRDGTMKGFDLPLLKSVNDAVDIPIVACGGAGTLDHLREAIQGTQVSAVAAGSMFVFHGKLRAVLINYPSPNEVESVIGRRDAALETSK